VVRPICLRGYACWTGSQSIPPVVITTWAVVNDVPLFIRTTLDQLRAAFRGDCWLAGNWSVRDLCERLEQVGVKVEVINE